MEPALTAVMSARASLAVRKNHRPSLSKRGRRAASPLKKSRTSRSWQRRARRSSTRSCAAWAKRKWRAPHFAVVVGRGGGTLDQLLAAVAGDPDNTSAGRTLAAAGRELRLLHRLHHGGALAPATVHRKHDHRGFAGRSRCDVRQYGTYGAALGDRARSQSSRHIVRGIVLHLHARAVGRRLQRNAGDQPKICLASAGGRWSSAPLPRAF